MFSKCSRIYRSIRLAQKVYWHTESVLRVSQVWETSRSCGASYTLETMAHVLNSGCCSDLPVHHVLDQLKDFSRVSQMGQLNYYHKRLCSQILNPPWHIHILRGSCIQKWHWQHWWAIQERPCWIRFQKVHLRWNGKYDQARAQMNRVRRPENQDIWCFSSVQKSRNYIVTREEVMSNVQWKWWKSG